MPKKFYTSLPSGYAVCQHSDCPKAKTCLHQIAYPVLLEKILISKFGRNAYYERRRGDTALTPKDQRIVLDALKKVGVTEEMKFESYEENTFRLYVIQLYL